MIEAWALLLKAAGNPHRDPATGKYTSGGGGSASTDPWASYRPASKKPAVAVPPIPLSERGGHTGTVMNLVNAAGKPASKMAEWWFANVPKKHDGTVPGGHRNYSQNTHKALYFGTHYHEAVNTALRTGHDLAKPFSHSPTQRKKDGTLKPYWTKPQLVDVGHMVRQIEQDFADDAFLVPKGQTLFRGTSGAFAQKLKVGTEFVDRGFVSTTVSKKQAVSDRGHGPSDRVVMRIRLATPARTIMNFGEAEVLLPRNTRFRVVSKTKDGFEVEAHVPEDYRE